MGHPIHKHMQSGMSRATSSEKYDAKEAYNKDLSSKARMHYLENDIADKKGMSRYSVEKGPHAKHGNAPHRDASPLNNITYGDKSGPTGYIGEQRADLMKYNPVDDRAGMSRYGSDHGDSPAKGLLDSAKKLAKGVGKVAKKVAGSKVGKAAVKGAKIVANAAIGPVGTAAITAAKAIKKGKIGKAAKVGQAMGTGLARK